jgi:SAM-dependent methyltransferase
MNQEPIQLINPFNKKPLHLDGDVLTDEGGNTFFCKNGAYRIVQDHNYASNFGFQWNKFQTTQIDRFQQNVNQSRERFFAVTEWDKQNLEGKNILEVGSGAGRFTQIVLNFTKATLYSVDYSNAVEANFRNNGPNERLKLFQASIYELPFAPASFDKVFCFGVLQHTPDFKKSVQCLLEMVKPGGELIIDFYPVKGWYTKIHAKYLLRPLFKMVSNERLLFWIENNVDWLMKLYFFFDRVGAGKIANRFLPLCDINSTLPKNLTPEKLREWVILDTFDMFSPAYDNPQPLGRVVKWLKLLGRGDVKGYEVSYGNRNRVTVAKVIVARTSAQRQNKLDFNQAHKI